VINASRETLALLLVSPDRQRLSNQVTYAMMGAGSFRPYSKDDGTCWMSQFSFVRDVNDQPEYGARRPAEARAAKALGGQPILLNRTTVKTAFGALSSAFRTGTARWGFEHGSAV